ncbi:MAG TPA: AzlC family ABC transporter permease [Desulfomonilia bacterium]|nr:AzlC family ABC transporter permease [Desulfomonilia bacterium]
MQSVSRESIFQGLTAATPIWIGYVAVGVPFGVLAGKAGISPFQIALMSVIVFAGSSQFIAISMMASGAAMIPIIITTFFVNLRHLLMSTTLALYLRGISKGLLSLFAYGITDESFAVNLTKFLHGEWDIKRSLVVNHTANVIWVASTIAGGYLGEIIPQGAFGIDYALTAMFIALLVYQLKNRLIITLAILSGSFSLIFSLLLPGAWNIVIASMSAASLGVVIQIIFRRKEIQIIP